jgi:hypothetical protein
LPFDHRAYAGNGGALHDMTLALAEIVDATQIVLDRLDQFLGAASGQRAVQSNVSRSSFSPFGRRHSTGQTSVAGSLPGKTADISPT